MTEYVILNEVARQRIFNEIDAAPVGATVTIEKNKKYSKKQRGALHVWCEQCAKTLNDHGIYYKTKAIFGNEDIEIPWDMELFKSRVYKRVLKAMTGKDSTEDQDSTNPSKVALVISKQYADNGFICPPWPSNRG